MTKEGFVKLGLVVALPFVVRITAKWRASKKERIAHSIPLFDGAVLEAALEPRLASDDRDVLLEIKDTLTKLNRQTLAEELWDLPNQLSDYYKALSDQGKSTLERALVRMIESTDRWLQLLAARTAGNIRYTSASEAIQRTINRHIIDAEREDTEVNENFVREMDGCVSVLDGGADKSSGSR